MANPVNTFAKFMLDTMSKSAQTTYADILNTRAREDAQAHDLERQQKAYQNDISKLERNYDLQDIQRTKQQKQRLNEAAKILGVNNTPDAVYAAVGDNRPQQFALLEYILGGDIKEEWFVEPPQEPSYYYLGEGRSTLSATPTGVSFANHEVSIDKAFLDKLSNLSEDQIAEMKKLIKNPGRQPTQEMLSAKFWEMFEVDIPPEAFKITELDSTRYGKSPDNGGGQKKAVNKLNADYGYGPIADPSEQFTTGQKPEITSNDFIFAIKSNLKPIGEILGANSVKVTDFRNSFRAEGEFNFPVLDEKIKDARGAVQDYRDFMAGYNETSDPDGGFKTSAANTVGTAISSALKGQQSLLEEMELAAARAGLGLESPIRALILDIKDAVSNVEGSTKSVNPKGQNWLGFDDYLAVIGHFEEQIYAILGPGE